MYPLKTLNKLPCLLLLLRFYKIKSEPEYNNDYGVGSVLFVNYERKTHHAGLSTPEDIAISEQIVPIFDSILSRRDKATFWLYTRKTINNPEEILTPIQNKTNYDRKAPLVVLVHGWYSNGTSNSVQYVKNAILTTPERTDNVIIMDWSSMLSLNYISSAAKTSSAAEKLKDFVQMLAKIYQIHRSKIHLIGHSLGAHVVGLAGVDLRQSNLTVSRVTGLDPAKPFFEFPRTYPGITREAADFVDIIHTCIGFLGIIDAVGHADFYPGGGLYQPVVCPNSIIPSWCEHSSAYIYFQKSLVKKFEARKCPNYVLYLLGICSDNEVQYMGEQCEPTARGTYFLDITSI